MAAPFPPTIEQLPYNWWTDRGGQPIVAIIAHGTVGTDSRAYLSRGGYLPDGSDKKVSIHALIRKPGDPIYRYVPDERGANHAGYGTMPAPWTGINPNKCTLSFELENLQDGKDPYTEDQLMAMGWLINHWRTKHGPLPIYRHTDIDPPPRKYDTVNLTVAQIEEWAVKAATPSDPLRVCRIPGIDGAMFYCGTGFYEYYTAKIGNRDGLWELGYPLSNEEHATGEDGRPCTVMEFQRLPRLKYVEGEGVRPMLVSEAKALKLL